MLLVGDGLSKESNNLVNGLWFFKSLCWLSCSMKSNLFAGGTVERMVLASALRSTKWKRERNKIGPMTSLSVRLALPFVS